MLPWGATGRCLPRSALFLRPPGDVTVASDSRGCKSSHELHQALQVVSFSRQVGVQEKLPNLVRGRRGLT
eukprot:439658-Pyramimonas_sp.AAC.1